MSDDAAWLDNLERDAGERLEPALHDYVLGGARDGRTAGRAPGTWTQLEFRPRVLRDVSNVEVATTLLGSLSPAAWGIAPTTLQRAVHPDGELAMSRAVAGTGRVMVVSSNAGTPFSQIGATGCRWWLQVYLPQNRELARPLLDRAVRAGVEAIVLTLDTPTVGTKYPRLAPAAVWGSVDPSMVRVNFDVGYEDLPGSEKALDLGPHDVAWLREVTALPVVTKGVLRPDDADRCASAGAAAVWVSNHGGRQLDRTISTADALAPVVAALEGTTVEVYVDGGLRSGLDVVAALALGADHVFLGRTPLLALMDGEKGVRRLVSELDGQIEETMRLLGCRDISLTRGCAIRARGVSGSARL